jgi:hypothetical protein
VGPVPAFAGQEAEAEPLAGPNRELIEVAAGQVERGDAGPFLDHVGDAEPMPPRNGDRLAEAEDRQRPEGDDVQPDPEEARHLIGREVHADEELVQEAKRDGQIRVQVDGVPGLVRGLAANGRTELKADEDEQAERDGRPEHVRIGRQQREELVHHRTVDATSRSRRW